MGIASFYACLHPRTKYLLYGVVPLPAWFLMSCLIGWDGYNVVNDVVRPLFCFPSAEYTDSPTYLQKNGVRFYRIGRRTYHSLLPAGHDLTFGLFMV